MVELGHSFGESVSDPWSDPERQMFQDQSETLS